MGEWKVERFWTETRAIKNPEGGWAVHLDSRPLRTPAKLPLVLPSPALARAVAAEWDSQDGKIDPMSMPFTRSANAAIDKVMPQFAEVAALIAEYGETDLCCYRAESPVELVARQAEAWDPLLDWAGSSLGAPLHAAVGIVPVAQPEDSMEALRARLTPLDAFAMTALHDLVSLSGSLLIGLAAVEGLLPIEELWIRSRVDESWQEGLWGADEEATATAESKRRAFFHADRFYRVSRPFAH
jgi:chaperone required for assembly of F1-ATPase